MWAKQTDSGIIEGWHGDGNFARTSILYALWKTQGLTIEPWRPDVRFGAVQADGTLYIHIESDSPWSGDLILDFPRHAELMHMPVDYPRINQFPEWFTAKADAGYSVIQGGPAPLWQNHYPGMGIRRGIPVDLAAGGILRLLVKPAIMPTDGS